MIRSIRPNRNEPTAMWSLLIEAIHLRPSSDHTYASIKFPKDIYIYIYIYTHERERERERVIVQHVGTNI